MLQPLLQVKRTYTETPDQSLFIMHTHDCYEIFCFLSGRANYFVEGSIYPLHPGDILLMKKSEAHSLLLKSTQPYERVVINFNAAVIAAPLRERLESFLDGRPLGKRNNYPATMFRELHWNYYIEQMENAADLAEQSAYLTVLLCELANRASSPMAPEGEQSSVSAIVDYINRHLSDPLSLDTVCQRFFISKSDLNKKFRQLVGTSVWDYITTKRLLRARELLRAGENPTKLYLQCGFREYCTFYRAYKQHFGVSPKADFQQRDRG